MRLLWAAVPLLLLIAACSTEFDPRAESDVYFSVWGALDASADTQWVRVAPLRATVDRDTEGAPIDADVSLVRLSDGQRWPLSDSLVTLSTGPVVHAFWTTADVEPEQTYRLDVRRSDGAETRATVRIPAALPPVVIDDGRCTCPSRVTVRGAVNLIDAFAIYRDPQTGQTTRFSKRLLIGRPDAERFTADVYYGDDARMLNADPFDVTRFEAELLVVAATDAWPDGAALGFEEALRPLDGGRVENGVGFVGGVVTQRLPFQPGLGSCPGPGSGPARPCFFPRNGF